MHYVIIGNGVAGINAANSLRNYDNDAEISIISYETEHHFSRTALMYVFCGQLSEQCVEPFERDHYEKMGFKRINDKVSTLDPDANKLMLESGKTVSYDKLLIACGSVPAMFGWPGSELDGVGNFVTWQDLQWLKEKAKTSKKAVVVGGGLIGIETVEILLLAGIDVTFLIREDFYWPIALDQNEGDIIADHMRHHKVDLRLKTEFAEILGKDGKVVGVKTGDGEIVDCDLVVIAVGVRPQTDWLKESSLALDERGGIIADENLKTNYDNIYTAGDCAAVMWFNNVRRPEQLWYTGRDQGKIAASNLIGMNKIYKRGTFYNSAKFFDIKYTTAGLVNFNLDGEKNYFSQEDDTNYTIRITYLPDNSVAGFNMLGRRWDHRVLVNWVDEKRQLDWVLKHLHEALFDEEFMPTFKLNQKVS